MSSLWPLGVAIYITGTFGEALGANLQRKSITDEAALVQAEQDREQEVAEQEEQLRDENDNGLPITTGYVHDIARDAVDEMIIHDHDFEQTNSINNSIHNHSKKKKKIVPFGAPRSQQTTQSATHSRQKRTKAKKKKKTKSKFKQPLWTMGFFLFVFAGIFMSMSLIFASQTVLAPMQLFLFVFNSALANWINHENFQWLGWDGCALFFVIVGVTMSIISAPKHAESYDNEQLIALLREPGFITFSCFAGAFIIACDATKRIILKHCHNDPSKIQTPWVRTALNLSYGATAGAFGGVNVTLTKTVFSLIVGLFNDGGVKAVVSSYILWLVSFVLIGTWCMQIFVTVSGLEVTSAIIVISAHSVSEEVTATLGGILYFQDYKKFEPWMWAMFLIGNAVAIVSVIGLSHLRLQDAQSKEAEQTQRHLILARTRAFSDGFLQHCNHEERHNQCPEGPEPLPLDEDNSVNLDPELGLGRRTGPHRPQHQHHRLSHRARFNTL